jgi:YVTN family beta-propeller protein
MAEFPAMLAEKRSRNALDLNHSSVTNLSVSDRRENRSLMMRKLPLAVLSASLLQTALFAGTATEMHAQSESSQPQTTQPQIMPSGQLITPLAPAGAKFSRLNPGLKDFPDYTVGQAVKTVISPDGNTLLVLTSGFNRLNDTQGHQVAGDSNEYVFVFDVSHGSLRQKQVLQVPNTFFGLAFTPDSDRFFVSGGVDDDVHVFSHLNGVWTEGEPVDLGHAVTAGYHGRPMVANLAVTADGKTLVAADLAHDAISLVNLARDAQSGKKIGELVLRPADIQVSGAEAGAGIRSAAENGAVSAGAAAESAHGRSPFGVAIKGNTTAYISSERDREIDVVDIAQPASPKLIARIPVAGNPNNILLNRAETRLFAAADNSDRISVIDTAANRVIEEIRTTAPAGVLRGPAQLPGAAPNSLALSPDEKTLYVTNGGMNAIAVIALGTGAPHRVIGLIPTGWYPQSISVSRDGKTLYDVNSKSDPGPNPRYDGVSVPKERYLAHQAANQYILQLEKAGLQAIPIPNRQELAWLTKRVAANDFLETVPNPQDELTMAALRRHIKHVIYIVKENRTYDQLLGDLDRGNGDPSLAEFGQVITPNQHRLATQFVDLDNTVCSGEVSGNGWPWSTAARESDFNVKTVPLSYAGRGSPPGDSAADGPEGEKDEGYIWDSALRHHLTLRNYGFEARIPPKTPEVPDPYASRTVVGVAVWPHLVNVTDPYFRGFDNAYPDFRRELEWEREFNQYVADRNLPDLEFVRFMHDHEGNFNTAIDGINTPEKETADNDYAVGKLIERVAHSPYADSTLIFVIEDDAQNGPDHVNAHRTVALIAGPYIKQGVVVHERYSTVNMVRTIEDVLGLGHLNLNDEYQRPMTAVFDLNQAAWNYTAVTPEPIAHELGVALKQSQLAPAFHDAQPAEYWTRLTRGFDWSQEDRIPAVLFNQMLWKGLTGGVPYPAARSGKDLSHNRQALVKEDATHFLYQQP